MRHLARIAVLATALGTCAATVPAASGAEHHRPRTERVSVTADGTQGDKDSYTPGISADGRYVTFRSTATNLHPGATGVALYIKDLRTGALEQANVASDGRPADNSSFDISLSADGRFAAFDSRADNLSPAKVPGDTDVFVRDRRTGRTELLLENRNRQSAYTGRPVMSDNGRYVAFASSRTDLVPGESKARIAVFVRDRWKRTTTRVSVRSDGSQTGDAADVPVMSADGSKVGYVSFHDLGAGQGLAKPMPSSFYVHDMRTGRTELVSDGTLDRGLGSDGRYALYTTRGTGMYAKDLRTGVTRRLDVAKDGTPGNARSRGPVMTADHRYVFFTSAATNLVPGTPAGHQAVFRRDLLTGDIERVDVADNGTPANGDSSDVAVDRAGRTAAFMSAADNLVPGDTNKADDVFVRRLK